MSRTLRTLIFADDLTGAADCAAAFLGKSREVIVALNERARLQAPVLAIDLNTRMLPEEAARAKVARAFSGQRVRDAGILFKKIDSTLRGHVAAELRAVRAALGPGRPIVIAPAFPAQGRIVRQGRIYIDGASMRRGNLSGLGADANTIVCDAETNADLRAIARKGLALRPRPLFVGSAGLARALAATLPRKRAAPRPRARKGAIVVVVGSASAVSAHQAKRLARIATHVGAALYKLEWPHAPTAADVPLVHAFARIAAKHPDCAAYVLTGGETARAVLAVRRVRGVRLLGEVEPGVPFGASIAAGFLICTKAGGFGGPDTLVDCVARLKREMRSS